MRHAKLHKKCLWTNIPTISGLLDGRLFSCNFKCVVGYCSVMDGQMMVRLPSGVV